MADEKHGLLPKAAQDALKRAAATPITKADPMARSKAIDQAVRRLKREYPDYFRE